MVENRQGHQGPVRDSLLDSQRLRELDSRAIREQGIQPSTLMESAAMALFNRLRDLAREHGIRQPKLTVLCGPGNNGGDALAVARYALSEAWELEVFVSGREGTELHRQQITRLQNAGIQPKNWREDSYSYALGSSHMILDGILGTGQRPDLEAWVGEWIQATKLALSTGSSIRNSRADFRSPESGLRIALDCPTGYLAGPESALEADYCFCIGAMNLDLLEPDLRPLCGNLEALTIGFPPELLHELSFGRMIRLHEHQAGRFHPPRQRRRDQGADFEYKSSRGAVGVAGGSFAYPGAPILCLRAAAAGGAGLLYLDHAQISEDRMDYLRLPWCMPFGLEGPDGPSLDALVAGPGWENRGGQEAGQGIVTCLDYIQQHPPRRGPALLVLDAGAINGKLPEILSEYGKRDFDIVLTPHPGEFRKLVKPGSRILPQLRDFAAEHGVWLILKTAGAHIAGPNGQYFCLDEPNSALGLGGSGDVLAGLVAAVFACRKFSLEQALIEAVKTHALAGRQLARRQGWFDAEALIAELGRLRPGTMRGAESRPWKREDTQ